MLLLFTHESPAAPSPGFHGSDWVQNYTIYPKLQQEKKKII